MANESSESLLTALEKSKEEPLLQLDHATRVAGVIFNHETHTFGAANRLQNRSGTDFRQQWLLKWLLKRLNEIVEKARGSKDIAPSSKYFIESPRTWAFLLYLLGAVKYQSLVEILLERDLCRILSDVSPLLLSSSNPTSSGSENHDFTTSDGAERPCKKRRLSSDTTAPLTNGIATVPQDQQCPDSLILFIDIFVEFSNALRWNTSSSGQEFRVIIPAWASSITEAASFTSCVLRVSGRVLQYAVSNHDVTPPSRAITSWLELWHGYSSATNVSDKQAVHQLFNDTCLSLCLDLLNDSDHLRYSVPGRNMRQSIDRQIALHTILPARTFFNDQVSNKWKAEHDTISWPLIQPLHMHIEVLLGKALIVKDVASFQYTSLAKVHYASSLISIASRLVPKDDTRRRQWERPWLEALSITLSHLAFSIDMPRLEKSRKGILESIERVVPPETVYDAMWPDDILETILDEDIGVSSPSSTYLVSAAMNWRNRSLPTDTISKLLRLDVDCFVPRPNNPNCDECLGRLMTVLEGLDRLSTAYLASVVENVILPLARGFSRARDLKGFIEIWRPRIEAAFRARAVLRCDDTSDEFDPAMSWADEEVFRTFESLCRVDAPQGFGKDLFDETLNELVEIGERIGPTADIFTKVMILNSIMRARRPGLLFPNQDRSSLRDLGAAAGAALGQKNDFQGQRWVLYLLLRTLHQLDPPSVETDDIRYLITNFDFKNFLRVELDDTKTSPQSVAQIFEAFQAFSLVSEINARHFDLTQPISLVISQTCAALKGLFQQHQMRADIRPPGLNTAWDGKYQSLRNAEQLICGLLAILLARPQFLSHLETDGLQDILFKISYIANPKLKHNHASPPTIASMSKSFHGVLSVTTTQTVFDELSNLVAEIDTITASSLPLPSSLTKASKSLAHDLVKRLYKSIILSKTTSDKLNREQERTHLVLLTTLVVKIPMSIRLPNDVRDLSELAAAIDKASGMVSDRIESYCMEKICEAFQARALAISNKQKKAELEHLMNSLLHKDPTPKRNVPGPSYVNSLVERMFSNVLSGQERELNGPEDVSDRTETARMARPVTGITSLTTNKELRAIFKHNIASMNGLDEADRRRKLGALYEVQKWTDCDALVTIAGYITKLTEEDIRKSPDVAEKLNQTATLQCATDITDPIHMVLALENSIIILQHHSTIVNQSTIDNVLQSIAAVASSSSKITILGIHEPEKDSVEPKAIYDRLLTILGILLTRYRRRLSGRSHLLLPALQTLLKCLFYTPSRKYIYQNPSTTKQKQSFRSSLPPWLQLPSSNATTATNSPPLPPSSAETLSRILSSISNPTTASARSAHRSKPQSHTSLTDTTQTAKRLAGQYLHVLIAEYARCTLDGAIAPEVREKLAPGLYTILDAMDRELMRALNAGLDPSGRAVFKGLYDEWMKFGRWDQS